jgi:mono/diheme cytochrome c family protein
MITAKKLLALIGVALIGCASAANAQDKKFDFGKREYDSNCASCHGLKGKGDGPYKPYLTKSPSDLTVLSKKNSGVYPFDRVYMAVDGRLEIGAHGTRDMPIWGAQYSVQAGGSYMDVPYAPESYVRTRILALTEYVFRLQTK